MTRTVATSNYRSGLTRLFVEDIGFNSYYLFASKTSNTSVINSNTSKLNFLENTLFGKRINSEEVFYMIRNYPWLSDTTYDQYDDSIDISKKMYYAVVYPENNQTGDYRIYKCLFNNYGARSINPPNYSLSTADQIYIMPDGYVWKFMYSLSEIEFEKYNNLGYIPIINEANSNTVVSDTSSVDQIFVTNANTNKGYEKVQGSIFEINSVTGEIVISETVVNSLSAVGNYYAGYTFYVTNNIPNSRAYRVSSYAYNPTTKRATIKLDEGVPNDGVLVTTSSYSLLPRIDIRGDGSGAVAIANVSNLGAIETVRVLNKGSGYTNATATVPDPFAFDPVAFGSLNERAILRQVLSPPGGHASNLVDELSCRHALVYVDRSEEHTYNEVRFRGKVHNVSNNFIYLCEYMGSFPNDIGTYANTDFSDISLKVNLPLLSPQNEVLVINIDNNPAYPIDYGVNYPGFRLSPYVQRSGEVYYMSSFEPITRTEESSERFKILLEF